MKGIRQLRAYFSAALLLIVIIGIGVICARIIREAARVANWKDSEISASILRDFRQAVVITPVANKAIDMHVSAHHGWTDLKIEGPLSEKEKGLLDAIAKQIAQTNENRRINVRFYP